LDIFVSPNEPLTLEDGELLVNSRRRAELKVLLDLGNGRRITVILVEVFQKLVKRHLLWGQPHVRSSDFRSRILPLGNPQEELFEAFTGLLLTCLQDWQHD
jgi:hypothetical protein